MFLDKRFSGPLAQLVEQLTFNQWVTGSNPVRLTTEINDLAGFDLSLILDEYTIGTHNSKFKSGFLLNNISSGAIGCAT